MKISDNDIDNKSTTEHEEPSDEFERLIDRCQQPFIPHAAAEFSASKPIVFDPKLVAVECVMLVEKLQQAALKDRNSSHAEVAATLKTKIEIAENIIQVSVCLLNSDGSYNVSVLHTQIRKQSKSQLMCVCDMLVAGH